MKFKKFEVAADDENRRLDKVLKRILSDSSASSENVFKLIRKNLVKVNEKKTEPAYTVKKGDVIFVPEFLFGGENPVPKKNGISVPENFCVETVFKNSHLWIVNKKSGIPVQGGGKEFALSDFVLAEFLEKQKTSLSFKPGPLHRIDKFTSGLVVFSQSLSGARWFSENIRNHRVKKIYLAATENHFESNGEMIFDDEIEGKSALTKITPVCSGEFCGREISLVRAEIQTGRKHQIRIHLSEHGHPVLGDEKYGGKKIQAGKFFLHAYKMEFPRNEFGVPQKISAPLKDEFLSLAKKAFPDFDAT